MLLKGNGPPLGTAAGGAGTHRCQYCSASLRVRLRHLRRKTQNRSSTSPEFIAVITLGLAQNRGLLILGLFLGGILREISVSTRIHVLKGGRIEEVLTDLGQPALSPHHWLGFSNRPIRSQSRSGSLLRRAATLPRLHGAPAHYPGSLRPPRPVDDTDAYRAPR
jgi:hypothetical protein